MKGPQQQQKLNPLVGRSCSAQSPTTTPEKQKRALLKTGRQAEPTMRELLPSNAVEILSGTAHEEQHQEHARDRQTAAMATLSTVSSSMDQIHKLNLLTDQLLIALQPSPRSDKKRMDVFRKVADILTKQGLIVRFCNAGGSNCCDDGDNCS